MHLSIFERTTLVHCRGQELSVGVLRERKRSAVVAQLSITVVPMEGFGLLSKRGLLGPPESSSKRYLDRFTVFSKGSRT